LGSRNAITRLVQAGKKQFRDAGIVFNYQDM